MDGEYIEKGKYGFYKEDKKEKVWMVEYIDDEIDGDVLFSFDTEKVYNFFTDYPQKLTPEEKKIFDEEHPEWRDFFKEG